MDSVYQHVLAWREALEKAVRIIGLAHSPANRNERWPLRERLLRETGHKLSKQEAAQLQRLHAEAYARLVAQVRPLPGARELLDYLSKRKVPWAVATSGRMESAGGLP